MADYLIPCGGLKLSKECFTVGKDNIVKVIGDGTGVTDYSGLTGKPQINGHELTSGDNTLETLGIQSSEDEISATRITQDATHRLVSDTEKSTWNAKATTAVASASANGLMSSSHFTKLEGIAENANNYVLPSANSTTIGGVKQASLVAEAAGENVTQAEFKALLDALKAAGIMASA